MWAPFGSSSKAYACDDRNNNLVVVAAVADRMEVTTRDMNDMDCYSNLQLSGTSQRKGLRYVHQL